MSLQTPCCTPTARACSCDCATQSEVEGQHTSVSRINTLAFSAGLCINCGMCVAVCPHAVFAPGDGIIRVVQPDRCMECGACERNCPAGALLVDSGVGCAAAMISAALRGLDEPTCGCEGDAACC